MPVPYIKLFEELMPFIGFIIFQVLFVVVLFVVMFQVWGRQTKNATEHLTGLNEDYMKKRDEVRKLTQEAEIQSRQLLDASQKEAAMQRRMVLEEADNLKAAILTQARKESEVIVQEAMKARDALIDEIHDRTREKALEQACKLLAVILPERLRIQIHEEFLADTAQGGFARIAGLSITEKVTEVQIASAFPFKPEYREALSACLEKLVGPTGPIQESLDPRLIAGFRLHLGHLVLDASLALKLKEAAQSAQSAV